MTAPTAFDYDRVRIGESLAFGVRQSDIRVTHHRLKASLQTIKTGKSHDLCIFPCATSISKLPKQENPGPPIDLSP